MKAPSHRQFGLLGLGLIALVNVLALGGVAWNRSAADARLVLSEREFGSPSAYNVEREDSEVSLPIDWRAAPGEEALVGPGAYESWRLGAYEREPGWLDAAKLGALGFDATSPLPGRVPDRQQAARVAWLVLELDGPAYQRYVASAAERAERAKAVYAASFDERDRAALEYASETLRRARDRDTRLFVVDGGRNRPSLRARYPDRARYAIVEGRVSMSWQLDEHKQWRAHGNIDDLSIPAVHLPRAQVDKLNGILRITAADRGPHAFFAVVAWGRRAEPWIESSGPR